MRAVLRCHTCREIVAELPMPLPRLAVETLHCRHCHSEQDLSRVQEQARVWHKRMSARLEAFESAA